MHLLRSGFWLTPYTVSQEGTVQIRDTHILRHSDTGKVKGAFVEFGSKDGLLSALQMNGTVSICVYELHTI